MNIQFDMGYQRASVGYETYRNNNVQNSAKAADAVYYAGGSDNSLRNATEQFDKTKEKDDADKKRRFDSYECQTCENRRYIDGSDDSGVSCQTPTKFTPESAAARVRGHEQEHVVRNQAKAEREGDEIVSQSVTLHTGICPECGKVYISGGTTETTIRKGSDKADKFNVGLDGGEKGKALDMAV